MLSLVVWVYFLSDEEDMCIEYDRSRLNYIYNALEADV